MKKKNKSPYLILGIIIIVALSYYIYDRTANKAEAPAEAQPQEQPQESRPSSTEPATQSPQAFKQATSSVSKDQPPVAAANPSQGRYSGAGEEDLAPDILVEQVVYDGKSFVPAVLDIQVGDIVVFKNSSPDSFWPASDPHPSHAAYPDFDAAKAVPAGGKYQVQFTRAGTFGYHDDLNSGLKGTINVTVK